MSLPSPHPHKKYLQTPTSSAVGSHSCYTQNSLRRGLEEHCVFYGIIHLQEEALLNTWGFLAESTKCMQ